MVCGCVDLVGGDCCWLDVVVGGEDCVGCFVFVVDVGGVVVGGCVDF